jgi:predicted phage baseplate assembly protein
MLESLDEFGRRGTVVHAVSRLLGGEFEPRDDAVTGATFELQPTDPPLPLGRRIVVAGFAPGTVPEDPLVAAATPPPLAEAVTVVDCDVVGEEMLVTVDPPLQETYDRASLRVRANVVGATHGETVEQVLGSGDATVPFQRFVTRRGPLTHVRATTPSGTRTTLEVRVDDVRWDEVESLDVAGPEDRVVAVRALDDGRVEVTGGGEDHGSRFSTGSENVSATYRVGIGAPGAMRAGQLSLLPRRPLGIRGAVNPGAAHDWAPPEEIGQARTIAPLRIRTLDRAVSVADHADFAANFAGVALSRADAVWDGRETVVVVSVLGTGGAPVSSDLVGDLGEALALARDGGTPFKIRPGKPVRFGVRVELAHDPAYEREAVETAVGDALATAYSLPLLPFATALAASRVLVTVRSVPGVVACTMPRLVVGGDEVDPVVALPARFEGATLRAAQVAGLDPAGVVLGVMAR